jgi:Fic family protein
MCCRQESIYARIAVKRSSTRKNYWRTTRKNIVGNSNISRRNVMHQIAEFLQESNLIEGYNTNVTEYVEALKEKEVPSRLVMNTCAAWRYVLQNYTQPMTVSAMLDIHRIQMSGLIADPYVGSFRNSGVRVGKDIPPAAPVLLYYVDQFIHDFNIGKDAMDLHFQYEFVHPHVDGNGRTGRLLWAWKRMQEGNEVTPMLSFFNGVLDCDDFFEKRQNYYDALSEYSLRVTSSKCNRKKEII